MAAFAIAITNSASMLLLWL